ncbi:MAG: sugar phosphate isomerase/epimerase family protein [Armatimonadota bacterium]|nr:sugar phosphate isomerase/epimerase family protein [Armatimonadota bacterium]
MKVGLSGIITPNEWSYEETLRNAKDAGYEAFELTFREQRDTALASMTDQKIADMVTMAEDMEIELASAVGSGEPRPDIMTNDETRRRESVDEIKRILEVVNKFGIDTWLLVPGRVSEECHYDDAYYNAREALLDLAPFAEDIDVVIAIEYVWNRFLLSPMEFARFLGEVGSSHVGLYFDTGNMVIQSYPAQWVKIVGNGVKKVHVKDFQRDGYQWKPLLEGDVNFPAVMEELRNIGYDDALISEVSPGLESLEGTAEKIRRIMAM